MNTIPFLYGELNKKVTPIEQSFIIRNTQNDFPKIGSDSKLYASLKPTALYIWNSSLGNYEIITSMDDSDAVTSVNNQTGDVHLTAQDVGALPIDTTIPSMTSQLVNNSGFLDLTTANTLFDLKGSAINEVANHNISTEAHSDIRLRIESLSQKLNNFLNVDDATTDQLSEVLALIDSNKDVIEEITTSKVNVSSIVDNLTTPLANAPLSANQGVVLDNKIRLTNNSVSILHEYVDESFVAKSDLINLIYPVGSIYMSATNTSPSIIFGGVWEQIKDTFLLASGDSYTAGDTGGEATHALTVEEMPKHNHGIGTNKSENGNPLYSNYAYGVSSVSAAESGDKWYAAGTKYVGGTPNLNSGESYPHNNMPPYLAVYVWKRVS